MRLILLAATIALFGGLAGAQDRAGQFDYWVMALSWSPNWCLREGDARGSPQCEADRDLGFILHGLWPQHETGWPQFCATAERPPSRSETAEMADIMGTSGLAWHQWRKHGVCSGLSSEDYFALSRLAFGSVARPDVLRQLTRAVRLPAAVVEEAFLAANPELEADMVTVTCKSGQIAEVRICLSRALEPRLCGADVRRDCADQGALLSPIR